MPFQFKKLSIPEVVLIEPKIFSDERGFFLELYKEGDFKELRGLHYQTNPVKRFIQALCHSCFKIRNKLGWKPS